MRNLVATVVQTAAVACLLVGLFVVSPLLGAGLGFAVLGFLLAPERRR